MYSGKPQRDMRYHRRLAATVMLTLCCACTGRGLLAPDDAEGLPVYQPRPVAVPAGAGYFTQAGKIRIVGYNDMQNMLSSLADEFSGFHPGMEFELVLKGTRTAPSALADGSSLLAPMGAEFEDQALADYRIQVGSDPVMFRVAHASLSHKALSGPLFFFVHPANPLQQISMPDAQTILTGTGSSEPLTRWGQLGLRDEWQDLPILPCGVSKDSALASYLQRHHFKHARFTDNFIGFKQSAEAVEFGARNPAAFCFASFNRLSDGVKPLAIAMENGRAPVTISEASVLSGSYPLTRHLLIYARQTDCGALDPAAIEFLKFVLSETGQSIIGASPEEYLPLSPKELKEENLRLAQYSKCNLIH